MFIKLQDKTTILRPRMSQLIGTLGPLVTNFFLLPHPCWRSGFRNCWWLRMKRRENQLILIFRKVVQNKFRIGWSSSFYSFKKKYGKFNFEKKFVFLLELYSCFENIYFNFLVFDSIFFNWKKFVSQTRKPNITLTDNPWFGAQHCN